MLRPTTRSYKAGRDIQPALLEKAFYAQQTRLTEDVFSAT